MGVGSRITGYDEQNNPVYENPCTGCGGDGKTTISTLGDTWLSEKFDKPQGIKAIHEEDTVRIIGCCQQGNNVLAIYYDSEGILHSDVIASFTIIMD